MAKFNKDTFLNDITAKVQSAIDKNLITREDMQENDLFEICRDAAAREAGRHGSGKDGTIGGTKIHMIHARGDEVVDFAQAERFAGEHGIPLTIFEDEHHTLSDHLETPDKIAQIALRFFTERSA